MAEKLSILSDQYHINEHVIKVNFTQKWTQGISDITQKHVCCHLVRSKYYTEMNTGNIRHHTDTCMLSPC